MKSEGWEPVVTGQTVMCGSGVGRPQLCLTLSPDRSWPSYHGAKFESRGPHGLMGEFRNLERRTEVRTRPNDLRTRVRLGAEGIGSSHPPHRGPCPALGATDGACLLCRGLPEVATPPSPLWSDCRLFRGLARGPAPLCTCTQEATGNMWPPSCVAWLWPGALFGPSPSQHVRLGEPF